MRRNVSLTNTAVVDTAKNENVSEYKIGHTTYIVTLHFNSTGESLTDVLNRLIGKSAGGVSPPPFRIEPLALA